MRALFWAVACSFSFAAAAEEISADKAAEGRELALTVCAACHIVAENQRIAPILRPRATSFSAMVRYRQLTESDLRQFLRSPRHGYSATHRKMPDLKLPEQYVDALVAYILSLKQH